MYAAALTLSAAVTVGTTGIPFFHLGTVPGPLPIQWFGAIVAAGVLIGAAILRRYAEWHKVSDDHIRGLTGWITVTGFLGAHWLDMIMYQGDKPWFEMTGWKPGDWPLVLKLWEGISSYGGFVGGALGFFFYVWWKRLPGRLMADIAIIGLLPAFSIGRIGCTVVSDHIGGWVDPGSTFAWLAQSYPRNWNNEVIRELAAAHPGTSEHILAWNLGLIEFLYLIPVNALILWLGFRKKRSNAGFITVLTGVLYAPVRFFLDTLRPEVSDTRHLGLTFAQWASMLAFGGAVYFAIRVFKNGSPAETMAPTAKEAQEMLRVAIKDADEVVKKDAPKAKVEGKPAAKPEEKDDAYAEAKRAKEEADEAAAIERRKKQDEAMAAKKAADASKKSDADAASSKKADAGAASSKADSDAAE